MWATLGAMLGVVLRGVALPIGLGVVWVLGVENLISGSPSRCSLRCSRCGTCCPASTPGHWSPP